MILTLSPWHPYLYDFLLTETDQHQGFFETENWIRQYAHDYNIPLYGSYDPTCIKGLDETDFFDGLHCKGCGIAKFFPGVPQVLQDVENNTLPDPLSVTRAPPCRWMVRRMLKTSGKRFASFGRLFPA